MTSIIKANESHAQLLSDLASSTFIESHGHSAKPEDINSYVSEKYNEDVLRNELRDPGNIYHILFYNNQAAGYSKIILNAPHSNIGTQNVAKIERIYLLKEFYNLNLGSELFQFNLNIIRANNQAGIWLFVWTENPRAINFYKKNGFTIIGSNDFKISENHSNPNYQMYLSLT